MPADKLCENNSEFYYETSLVYKELLDLFLMPISFRIQ